ncbi:Alpha/Beta hydrolase protein [Aspergillus heterothallicus]
MSAKITPFTISIPDSRLTRLHQKLSLADFPSDEETTIPNTIETPNSNEPERWSRGAPVSEIKRLTAYWKTEFNWRAVEARLNTELPQFTTDVEIDGFGGYTVHFVHRRGGGEEAGGSSTTSSNSAIPLLFLHGWPGSFLEVGRILPLLVDGDGDGDGDGQSFHVVAPSLIDFGFSGASRGKAFGLDQHAEAYHKLMLALGYSEYIIQSGDLGYLISRRISALYGPNIKAIHTNSALPAPPTALSHPELLAAPLSEFDAAGLARTTALSKTSMGYFALLTTKPATIAHCLADSPVGLLAWICEKLHDWGDDSIATTNTNTTTTTTGSSSSSTTSKHGGWSDEDVVTWVCVHYFSTAGPGAPGNLYYALGGHSEHGEHGEHGEATGPGAGGGAFELVQRYVDGVPLGISRFAGDVVVLPGAWNATLGPVVVQSEYAFGGHFGAWECPREVVGDVRKLVREVGVEIGRGE